MRLALITQDFPPEIGGIETYSYELAKRFAGVADRFLVVAPSHPDSSEADREMPFEVMRIPGLNSWLGISALPYLPPALRKQGVNLLFHSQWQTLPLAEASRRLGIVDHVFAAAHARELLFNPFGDDGLFSRGYSRYRKRMLRTAEHWFPVSGYTANLLNQKQVPMQQITTVINGTDPERFYPKSVPQLEKRFKPEGEKLLLTITRIDKRKGIDTVIRALPGLLEKYPKLTYLVVGEGEYRQELEELSRKLKVGRHVHFTGKVAHEMLNDYYNVCDCFVMPSKTVYPNVEGFGIVFLEANAAGKPVIGSYSGGIPSAVRDGQTGLLVDEDDPRQLAEAIDRLLVDPELARTLGNNGRKRVLERANWNAVSTKLLNEMNQIMNRPRC